MKKSVINCSLCDGSRRHAQQLGICGSEVGTFGFYADDCRKRSCVWFMETYNGIE